MTEAAPDAHGPPPLPKRRRGRVLIGLLLLAAVALALSTQVTLFVVQPIGAVPEGRTLLMLRQGRLQFIDSADAICARQSGKVSLICRGVVLGQVAKEGTILLRLPYSELLYLASTGGAKYGAPTAANDTPAPKEPNPTATAARSRSRETKRVALRRPDNDNWQFADYAHVLADGVALDAPGGEPVMRASLGDRFRVLERRAGWAQIETEFEDMDIWLEQTAVRIERERLPDEEIGILQRRRDAATRRARREAAADVLREEADIEVVDWRWSWTAGGAIAKAEGVVRNTGDRTLRFAHVVVTWSNASGGLAAMDDAYLAATTLPPGETTTFKVMETVSPTASTATVTFQDRDGSPLRSYSEKSLARAVGGGS